MRPCESCLQEKPLIYRVQSEVLDIDVCFECGHFAEEVQKFAGTVGQMKISLIGNVSPLTRLRD